MDYISLSKKKIWITFQVQIDTYQTENDVHQEKC